MRKDVRDYWDSHGDELSAHYGGIITREAMRAMGRAMSPAGNSEMGGDWLFSLTKLWHTVMVRLLREAIDHIITNTLEGEDSETVQIAMDQVRQLRAMQQQVLDMEF